MALRPLVLHLAAALLVLGAAAGCGSPAPEPPPSGQNVNGTSDTAQPPRLDNCVTQLPNAPTDPATIRFAGASMKIHRLGLDAKNDIDLTALDNAPADAGWYCYSPAPGLKGPSVLLGHVDWNGGRPAAFAKLKTLKAGNEITVTTAGGTTLIFRVTKVEQVKKVSFPADEVYGDTLDSQLRLITCGGVFDHKAKSYVDNTIVFLTKRAKAG